MTLLGGRLSRDTAIYVLAVTAVFPFSIAQVAFFTRYLTPAQFGVLGVLSVVSGLLTTLYNLGSLQGIFLWTFGTAGGEGDGDGDGGVDIEGNQAAPPGKKRRALGTGLVLTCLIAGIATGAIALLAHPIARLLVHETRAATAVRWMALSAATGGLWRLVVNVFRMELRPRLFSAVHFLRPTAVLGASIPLVATGHGIAGAMAGTAIGTSFSLLVCLAIGWRSYTLAFHPEDLHQITRRGSEFVGVVLGLWVTHNADLFLLSRYTSHYEVGLYRLASRVASIPSYFVGAFLMAQAPLQRTSLFRAAYDRHGFGEVKSAMFTYYVLAGLSIVLFLGLASNALVLVAAHSYQHAAPLIPVIGVAFVAYGCFLVLIRSARTPSRVRLYNGGSILCAVIFIASALVLIPWLGSYGAPLATIVAMTAGSVMLGWFIQRSEDPLPFQYRRLIGGLLLAGGCYGIGLLSAALPLAPHVITDVLAWFLYPVLLIALRVIPRDHIRPLLGALRLVFPQRSTRQAMLSRLESLPARRRSALEAVLRERRPISTAASDEMVTEDELRIRIVRAIRSLAAVGEPGPDDGQIGEYLLSDLPPAGRDTLATRLWSRGIDPLELHELDTALSMLKHTRRSAWRRAQRLNDASS